MKHLVEFPTEDGGVITVEVEDQTLAGTVRAANMTETTTKAVQSFEAALAIVKPASESILARIRDLGERPDEVTVQFGVKMTASAGAIIASTAGEANFSINLKWTKKP